MGRHATRLVLCAIGLQGCVKQPTVPEPVPPPQAAPSPEVPPAPAAFSPDKVGVNWVVALSDGALSCTNAEGASPSAVEFVFFQGLLSAEDRAAGRHCTLRYALAGAEASTELAEAWAQWTLDTSAEPEARGRCDEPGAWGTTPAAWLAETQVVVGLGPVSEATLAHLEPLWSYYEAQFGGPLAEVTPNLIGGHLKMGDAIDADWGFGAATAADTSPDGTPAYVAADELHGDSPTSASVAIMGMRPYPIPTAEEPAAP